MRLCTFLVASVSALSAQPAAPQEGAVPPVTREEIVLQIPVPAPAVENPDRKLESVTFTFRAYAESLTELRVQAGGPKPFFWILYERVGQLAGPVNVRVSDLPPAVSATGNYYESPEGPSLVEIYFYAGVAAIPGEYSVRIVAEGGGEKHEVALRLVVDAPNTVVTSRLVPPNYAAPVTSPPAAVEGHKTVMLVLGMDAGLGMKEFGCEVVRQIARKFSEGLQPGRDALGIVEAGASVRMALPLTTDFDAASRKVAEEFAQVECTGSASTLYALERAHEQLKRADVRNTERIVVVAVSQHGLAGVPLGMPNAIAAKWPVRTKADSRGFGDLQDYFSALTEQPADPSQCMDNLGRHYPDPTWATGNSMPDRTGILEVTKQLGLVGPIWTADRPTATSPSTAVVTNPETYCAFSNPGGYSIQQDLAYLPETDLGGVPLDGPRPLIRFTRGPYSGKIRPDSWKNTTAALQNLFDGITLRLSDDGIRVIVLYVCPYIDARRFDTSQNLSIGNVPGTSSFNAAKPPVMLVSIHDVEQVPYLLENIWATLGRTRRQ